MEIRESLNEVQRKSIVISYIVIHQTFLLQDPSIKGGQRLRSLHAPERKMGEWGSDLEALAAAEIYIKSPCAYLVLIWSNGSKAHGFLMNHGVHTTNKGAIHF